MTIPKKKDKEIKELLKKYNLTIGDLPAFPPKKINWKKLIIAIGEAKRKRNS